jgi:hypothetical protein
MRCRRCAKSAIGSDVRVIIHRMLKVGLAGRSSERVVRHLQAMPRDSRQPQYAGCMCAATAGTCRRRVTSGGCEV